MESIHTRCKMKTLKRFGFFPSTPTAQAVDNLSQLAKKHADPREDKIIAYLEAGHAYLADAGIARDLIDPQHPVIGVPNVRTDGEWAWTEDVVYYVRKYHIGLPAEMMTTMAKNEWVIPKVKDFSEFVLS